jgi:hypothetical protein
MATIIWLGPLLTILAIIAVLYVVFVLGRGLVGLLVSSVIGIIVLWAVNLLPGVSIPINIWSVLITVIGGVAGVILLIILNLAGIFV